MKTAGHPNEPKPELEESLPPVGFLADLESESLERLSRAGEFVDRPKGAVLAVQGLPHHAMAMILSGRVALNRHDDGNEFQVAVLRRGDVVGEMSVIDPRVARFTAQVIGDDARLWIIEREEFDRFVAHDPTSGSVLLLGIGKVLCRRVRTECEQLHKAEQRISHYFDMDY